MEYDFAIEAGIPALAFLHKSPGEIAAGKTEPTEIGKASLTAFRKKIEARRHAEYWNSPKELAGQVALAMMSLMQIKPRVGWVRADRVPDESAAKEMLRLRERLEDAEGKLALVQSSQQKDTEHLSQGDERISLKFMFNNSRYGSGEQAYPFSWNELLAILGPVLLTPVSQPRLAATLQNVVQNQVRDQGGAISNVQIRDEDFEQVKIQFRALGLMTQVDGSLPRWVLTPYGDRLMTQVAAIRSKKVLPPGNPSSKQGSR